ncbi:tetratricopeptide repeat protein [Parvularcula sp. ZS-1/3]|uniref:Tetratricopeptide repeat protein n=1 Tax=Parvularcula mediterranea TaxID=2732508 RepID=A0A7Y3RJH5_9PROT|nr:tetratricopeptide repeat protein [Parvularcula mediterranea]NNU15214.1 tetratricopeptide repeat protein [Parvularcula mediterranea]
MPILLFSAVQAADLQPYGREVCSVETGPEVGVGILCERALVALEAREVSVARELSETASKLAPSHPGVWIVRAKVARSVRQLDEARKHFEKAASLEPDNPAILIAAGDFEAEEGNVRGAAGLYERAAVIDPSYPGLAARLEALGDDVKPNEI